MLGVSTYTRVQIFGASSDTAELVGYLFAIKTGMTVRTIGPPFFSQLMLATSFTEPEELAAEIAREIRRFNWMFYNKNRMPDKQYVHFIFSLSVAATAAVQGDALSTEETMRQLITTFLRLFGLEEHAFVFVIHIDTDNLHTHLVVSMVGRHGNVYHRSNDYLLIQQTARVVERMFNFPGALTDAEMAEYLPRADVRSLGKQSYWTEQKTGTASPETILRKAVGSAFQQSSSLDEFANACTCANLFVRPRLEGSVVTGLTYAQYLQTAPGYALGQQYVAHRIGEHFAETLTTSAPVVQKWIADTADWNSPCLIEFEGDAQWPPASAIIAEIGELGALTCELEGDTILFRWKTGAKNVAFVIAPRKAQLNTISVDAGAQFFRALRLVPGITSYRPMASGRSDFRAAVNILRPPIPTPRADANPGEASQGAVDAIEVAATPSASLPSASWKDFSILLQAGLGAVPPAPRVNTPSSNSALPRPGKTK